MYILGINAPTAQSLFNYVLLAVVYGCILIYRRKPLKVRYPYNKFLLLPFDYWSFITFLQLVGFDKNNVKYISLNKQTWPNSLVSFSFKLSRLMIIPMQCHTWMPKCIDGLRPNMDIWNSRWIYLSLPPHQLSTINKNI